jgi:hypothetical protein
MPARVVFTAGFSRRYTGGVREFEVEARNLRGVIKAMDQLYRVSAITSRKRPPSRSTAPSTRPPISSRFAPAVRSSSSQSSKADRPRPPLTAFLASVAHQVPALPLLESARVPSGSATKRA